MHMQDRTRYQVPPGEIVENDDLVVDGETLPEDIDADADDTDIPVRVLIDFVVYEWDTQALVETAELLNLVLSEGDSEQWKYGASGVVASYVDDDDGGDDGDDDDDLESSDEQTKVMQRVKLSPIIEFNVHHLQESSTGRLQLDPKIYVRTQYAWYILERPSDVYYAYFCEFWIKHRMTHLVLCASLENHRVDQTLFVKSLKVAPDTHEDVAVALSILRRELTANDLQAKDVMVYAQTVISDLCRENSRLFQCLLHVPLIRTVGINLMIPSSSKPTTLTKPVPRVVKKPPGLKHTRDIEKVVLQNHVQTVVTPVVGGIAGRLFTQALQLAGDANESRRQTPDTLMRAHRVHQTDPDRIDWVKGSKICIGHYSAALIDGVKYSVGDFVIVEKGSDSNTVRAKNASKQQAKSDSWLANHKWFGQITDLFERETGQSKRASHAATGKYFHCRWLQHGSQTLLQETAHPNELFFLNECDDLPLACIYQKCRFRYRTAEDAEIPDESGDNFYGWLTWDNDHVMFVQTAEDEAHLQCRRESETQCPVCVSKARQQMDHTWVAAFDGGIRRHGIQYHIYDFIYVIPSRKDCELYDLAQIMGFKFGDDGDDISAVIVQMYGRYDSVARDNCASKKSQSSTYRHMDNQHLFWTEDSSSIHPSAIAGKFFVAFGKSSGEDADWLRHNNHFYVDLEAKTVHAVFIDQLHPLSGTIPQCKRCMKARSTETSETDRLSREYGPLQGLELFAGAGGLSVGLEMSGVVKTKWAVECSPSAAMTYSANHPSTIVYNQNSNTLLLHAMEAASGKEPAPLFELQKDNPLELPPMPQPGEVDFIYGGPPCQGFSMMNHHRTENDVRNTLVCNMLSYVELYQPRYFLLENVRGLLHFPPKGAGGVEMVIVKFIMRALTALGYQVSFKVLQAAQYGAPQSRRRVIFWGARHGLAMPAFPIPTHASFHRNCAYHLPTGDTLHPPTQEMLEVAPGRFTYRHLAPLMPVTVNDAISDLPQFDWINPFLILPPTPADCKEIRARLMKHIHRFNAVSGYTQHPGYVKPRTYGSPSMNRYQVWIRQGNGTEVSYHYTRRFNAQVVERVTQIPLKAGADFTDLPHPLRIARLYDHNGEPKRQGRYGRINGDDLFQTAMTTVNPNAKGGMLLHPSQKRILTVRECARAQGFPDYYKFESASEKLSDRIIAQHRQIGNAVPIPLALALGRELRNVVVAFWRETEQLF